MTKRPNILVLESDQHSAHTMSCAGHPVIRTPNMDRLAREGVRFRNTYCPTPLCVPSRVALLTGRYGHNTGLLYNTGVLQGEEPTFAQALEEAGYHTCVTGKIHLAQGVRPGDPGCAARLEELGFAESMPNIGKVFAALDTRDDMYRKYLRKKGVFDKFYEDYVARWRGSRPRWYAEPSVLSEEDFHDAYIGRITRDWLAEYDGEEPFFCWCNWGGPHAPWDAPGRYARMYDPQEVDPPIEDSMEDAPAALQERRQRTLADMPSDAWRAVRASYYGMIDVVDDAIGSMLEVLARRVMLEDTVVIYISDHGEMLLDHGLFGKMRMYESSARVPCIVRWPARFAQGLQVSAPISLLDLIPTLLEIAGALPLPMMHGQSLLAALEGKGSDRGPVYTEMGPTKMVRLGNWKYVYNPDWETQQLFNLQEDPEELHNLVSDGQQADRERKMRHLILDWMIATEDRPNTPVKPWSG